MVELVSKIDARSLEKDHTARDGTEWRKIEGDSVLD
jgi:hypothetical protein